MIVFLTKIFRLLLVISCLYLAQCDRNSIKNATISITSVNQNQFGSICWGCPDVDIPLIIRLTSKSKDPNTGNIFDVPLGGYPVDIYFTITREVANRKPPTTDPEFSSYQCVSHADESSENYPSIWLSQDADKTNICPGSETIKWPLTAECDLVKTQPNILNGERLTLKPDAGGRIFLDIRPPVNPPSSGKILGGSITVRAQNDIIHVEAEPLILKVDACESN